MPLLKSISGVRGTIGGTIGQNLTPADIVRTTSAYGSFLLETGHTRKVVVGRDGRMSGKMVSGLAIQTLIGMGIDIIDLGLSTTPTVEMAVVAEKAGGGIVFTASHNPENWNALKFLDHKGEFISRAAGQRILELENVSPEYSDSTTLGRHHDATEYFEYHVAKILELEIIDADLIRAHNFNVVIDCINSTGALALPVLCDALNVSFVLLNDKINGRFKHNPEPLPAHLSELMEKTRESRAHLGIAVDPDVDRLALVCEDGQPFNEEYTLIAASDFVLSRTPGPTVSNLSSSRALADITRRYNQSYYASAVGEVNVVEKMKSVGAVIGGEGNGGVIYPALHYGRDALVGIAFVLNLLAEKKCSLSALKAGYPAYHIVKNKIDLDDGVAFQEIKSTLIRHFKEEKVNTEDGVKIDFAEGWVHMRPSNTEPIIRVYAEAKTEEKAVQLIKKMTETINAN